MSPPNCARLIMSPIRLPTPPLLNMPADLLLLKMFSPGWSYTPIMAPDSVAMAHWPSATIIREPSVITSLLPRLTLRALSILTPLVWSRPPSMLPQ